MSEQAPAPENLPKQEVPATALIDQAEAVLLLSEANVPGIEASLRAVYNALVDRNYRIIEASFGDDPSQPLDPEIERFGDLMEKLTIAYWNITGEMPFSQ